VLVLTRRCHTNSTNGAPTIAPITLYPDPLLAQILTASTYPLEVVMAARWSKDHPDLKGKDLENAMQQQPWEPSVKGLTAVPQVLTMMNEKLDWTQQLGEAFLTQPDDITKAVQALRARAESIGNLKTTKEQRVRRAAGAAAPPPPGEVVVAPEYIVIEPVEPEVIYVPVYDPVVIYGVDYWPAAYVPFFWYPSWWVVGPVWGFWPAYYVGPALWCQYNWGFGHVQINVVQFNAFNHTKLVSAGAITRWNHNPIHHQGVPYKNTNLQQKFGKASSLGGGPKGGVGPKGGSGPKSMKFSSKTVAGGGPKGGDPKSGGGPKVGSKSIAGGAGRTSHKHGGGPKGAPRLSPAVAAAPATSLLVGVEVAPSTSAPAASRAVGAEAAASKAAAPELGAAGLPASGAWAAEVVAPRVAGAAEARPTDARKHP
jgi:hypothetical protein